MPFAAEDAFSLLQEARARGRLAQAYLISGSPRSGKRGLVGQIAAALFADSGDPWKSPDLHAIEPQMKSRVIGVDAMRDLLGELQMRSLLGGAKIAVIHDADRMNEAAANALLRTLEEPPGPTYFFLISTQPEQILSTILSRCVEIPLRTMERPPLTARQRAFLEALSQAKTAMNLADVFTMVRRLSTLLAEAKAEIEEQADEGFEKEAAQLKQAGVKKEAIEEREASYKALVESRYRAEREMLVGTAEQWFADALRQQHGAPELDHEEFRESTAALAAQWTTLELLRRTAALAALRDHLGRNVPEQLAIECAFLKAFGP
jgi:DNA polymerase-3 subunit delta'